MKDHPTGGARFTGRGLPQFPRRIRVEPATDDAFHAGLSRRPLDADFHAAKGRLADSFRPSSD